MKRFYTIIAVIASVVFSLNAYAQSALTVDAGECDVVYYGYEPMECTDLNAVAQNASGPVSFSWSTGENTQSINVCPQQTAWYYVTATDTSGASAMDSVEIHVVDVRCGANMNKISVCHVPPGNPANAHQICIALSAVPAHIDSDHGHEGCYVGPCGVDPCDPTSSDRQANVSIFPNPTSGSFNVVFAEERLLTGARIEVFDLMGNLIVSKTPNGLVSVIELDKIGSGSSLYIVRTYSNRFCYIRRLMLQ